MDPWSGVWTALISAGVALLTSVAFRWWDRKRVTWLVTGFANTAWEHGRPTDLIRITVEVHNVGDDDAYDVHLRRCNGTDLPSWVTFEAGKVAAGDSFTVEFLCSPERWETAWIEIIARTSPVRREPKTWPRVVLSTRTGRASDHREEPKPGRGRDLPETAGGRLPGFD